MFCAKCREVRENLVKSVGCGEERVNTDVWIMGGRICKIERRLQG